MIKIVLQGNVWQNGTIVRISKKCGLHNGISPENGGIT